MSKDAKKIMLVVGEASGDLYGAQLVNQLYRQDPSLDIYGVAGENLKREGIRVLFDVARLAGMGLAELIGNIKSLWLAYWLLRRSLKDQRPDLLILIDFPEFNLRLARLAHRWNIPVLYYISPQVWAWRKGRTRKIARWVSRIAVVFPFEVPLYEKEGARVTFVGHPLLDLVHSNQSREDTLKRYRLDPDKQTIVMLPGSRKREVEYLLPLMLRAAARLSLDGEIQFVVLRANTVKPEQLEEILSTVSLPVAVVEMDNYNLLNAANLAWVASGTATLEAALLKKPMIIVYRLSWITYLLARLLVRVNHIGMVNIIAGDRVVPELIQDDVTAEKICSETQRILSDKNVTQQIVGKLENVRERLGSPGAPQRVAELALSLID
ncbi:MAG: lipid-A-disaccharide synthase [Deltaproteobacteria bacterium]|nr:lipid-A-disaccharide synthase [Deltaproteobacteria bacterium]